jgi:hypothetical protein
LPLLSDEFQGSLQVEVYSVADVLNAQGHIDVGFNPFALIAIQVEEQGQGNPGFQAVRQSNDSPTRVAAAPLSRPPDEDGTTSLPVRLEKVGTG